MKNRYCVEVLTGWTFFHGNAHAQYTAKFFETLEAAEEFRSQEMSRGHEVTKVMDLENLPF